MKFYLLKDWGGYVKDTYVFIDDETICKYLIDNGIAKKSVAPLLPKDKMVRSVVFK